MRNFILTILLCILSTTALATRPPRISMLKVVTESDHVLTVSVIDVEMIDKDGNQITDLNARTGPGNGSVILLVCEVTDIHLTNASEKPKNIKIPLDSMMHYSFKKIKKAHERKYPMLVILKGKDFLPAFRGKYHYPSYELETILELFKLKNNRGEI